MKKIIIIFTSLITLVIFWLLLLSYIYPVNNNVNIGKNSEDLKKIKNKSSSVATNSGKDKRLNEKKISQDEIAEESLEIEVKTDDNFNAILIDRFPYIKNNNLMLISFLDTNGNTLETKNVLREFGINIPDELLDKGTVKMYIYRGKRDFGPSEALLIKNNNTHSKNISIMRNWEKKMPDDIKTFILAGEKYDLMKVNPADYFSDSYYYRNGRYVNFTHDSTVSLNYVVEGEYIIIANSFSVLHVLTPKIFSL